MMHIAFCTDTNYVMPTGVAMISVCENNKEDITFHLVITDEGTSRDEVERKVKPLKDIAERYGKHIVVYRMDAERLKKFECKVWYISTTAFSRIFLPEILPSDIDKVLYLDCDLVCDGSLKDLWNTELNDDCPIGAVVDLNYASPRHQIEAQIPPTSFYINSGVLLMNLDCWRKNNYSELAVSVASEKQFTLLDQDTLNHIFIGKIHYLHPRYNVLLMMLYDGVDKCQATMDFYYEMKEACDKPVIIHYAGPDKPWTNEISRYCEYWDKYQAMSIWKEMKRSEQAMSFDRTNIYTEFNTIFSMDSWNFLFGLTSYMRFFQAALRFKNKSKLLHSVFSSLDMLAGLLEKVYKWKTRK